MFSQMDKAWVAALGGLMTILTSAGVTVPPFMTEQWTATAVGVLTPVFVYFWPNKGKAK